MTPKGFRQPAQPSKKAQVNQMAAELQNLQMSSRISQMMLQQLMQNLKQMSEDLNGAMNQLFEMQYKQLAVQKALNLDQATLDKIANEQRLKDFVEAAAKADTRENMNVVDVVGDNSTITITSTALDVNGKDCGIFRSRLKLAESGVPALITALAGKKVGDKVSVTLNGNEHQVELLAIRDPQPEVVAEATAETATTETAH